MKTTDASEALKHILMQRYATDTFPHRLKPHDSLIDAAIMDYVLEQWARHVLSRVRE